MTPLGAAAALGVLAAYWARLRTGKGQFVDVAIRSCL